MPRKTKLRPPITVRRPGEILFYDFLEEGRISQTQLSEGSGISLPTINYIIQGRARITPRIALGFSKFFKNDKYYWMKIQNEYDFWELERGGDIK